MTGPDKTLSEDVSDSAKFCASIGRDMVQVEMLEKQSTVVRTRRSSVYEENMLQTDTRKQKEVGIIYVYFI